jgi:WD40 repeat protein
MCLQVTEDGKKLFVYAGTEPVDGIIRINVGAPINDLAFAPGGEALATASSDGHVQIWSASGGAAPTPSLSWLAHECAFIRCLDLMALLA